MFCVACKNENLSCVSYSTFRWVLKPKLRLITASPLINQSMVVAELDLCVHVQVVVEQSIADCQSFDVHGKVFDIVQNAFD